MMGRLSHTPVKLPEPKTYQQWFKERQHRPIEIFLRERRKINVQPQPEWMRCVRPGDVLENRKGSQRVVRTVFYYRCGALHSVHCTIRHCSEYHQCYTSLEAHRLLHEGWRRVAHVKLNSRLDKLILEACLSWENLKDKVDCCSVKGVA